MKMMFRIFSAILIMLVLSGCSLLPQEDEYQISPVIIKNSEVTYKTTFVQAGDISKTEEIICTYKPVKTNSYSFDITGEFYDTVYVSAGDAVKKGELLAQLNISMIESQLSTCYHEINTTYLSLTHMRETRNLKFEQQKALIEAALPEEVAVQKSAQDVYNSFESSITTLSNQLTVLQMKASELESQKSERQIYAQFSGNVTTALVRSSTDKSVQAEVVVTIADTSTSMFTSNTQYYSYFNIGDTHNMIINGEICTVKVVDPKAYGIEAPKLTDGAKAVVYFEMEDAVSNLDENGSGKIELVLEKAEGSMYVVNDAIISTSSGSSVYCFDENGTMRMKSVKTGIITNTYTEILEGVEVGEELILG